VDVSERFARQTRGVVPRRHDRHDRRLRQSSRQTARNSGHGESYHGAHIGTGVVARRQRPILCCRAMRTGSHRVAATLLAAGFLGGWLSASWVSPPAATTQAVAARPRPAAPAVAIPRVALERVAVPDARPD